MDEKTNLPDDKSKTKQASSKELLVIKAIILYATSLGWLFSTWASHQNNLGDF